MRRFGLATALSLSLVCAPATIAQTPPVAAASEFPRGPLGDAAVPTAYRLDLTIDPAKERFSGKTEIDVTLKAASPSIVLHGRNFAMRAATAKAGGQTVPGTWTQLDESGVARLDFDRPLPAGPVTLAFDYDGPFQDGPAGLFRVNVGGQWYSWSQFQSIDARAAFPSFDQPSFKTPFTVTLRTPAGLKAVSNAPQTGVTREAGLDVHRFAPTLPLPTYLVAVMTGPFIMVEGQVAPTPQRAAPLPLRVVSTQPNAGKLDFALEGSKGIVTLLEDYFGDAFPYPKLDQISSPIMPGAMENAGADLYGDGILITEANAPTGQKRTFGMVVAHELAHQWFGDLVTPAWWDDIWLNESFANWMGYRIGHAWRPDLNIGAGALAEGFAAMGTDELTAGRPIRQPIETNDQIDAAFDTITYGKGGHVVAMIAGFMGDGKFRDGVRRYMAAHRYGNATSRDFFAAMAEAAGDPRIIPAMQSFTDQQGVPLLTFTRGEGGFTVTQSRYAPLGAAALAQRWGVPLCVRRGEARACQLLTDDSAPVAVGGEGALVPNAGGTGYYRFDLDAADWDALIAGAGGLSGGEALAAADSLDASVRAGRASAAQLAALARVLVNHPDSHAADAATNELAALAGSGVVDAKGKAGLRRFVARLYRPVLARYGFDPRAGAYAAEDPDKAQRRAQIVDRLAGTGRDSGLRKTLNAAAEKYLAGDAAALDPTWYGNAFEIYLNRTRMAGAKALMDKALASEDPLFRPAALDAVANSGDKAVARWLLEDFSDDRLRPAEKRDFLPWILTNGGTRDLGYAWMRRNLDTLLSGGGGVFYAAKMPQWLRRFCAVEKADEFARELRGPFAGKTGALELERVIDRVRDCGVLKSQRGAAISKDFGKL